MKTACSFALSAAYGAFRLDARAAWSSPATALFGASGSGKSTILEAIAGLRPEVSGTIEVGGRRLDGVAASARRIGWVPQDGSLFPHLSVRGNLDFASRAAAGRAAPPPGEARDAAALRERSLDVLELRPLLERRVTELSGGERQRVAVARALASAPDLLLLDEPLAAVDRPLRARIVPFLARLPEAIGVPFLVVTHDPHEVLALATDVLVLQDGRIVAQGPAREVLPSASWLGALEALAVENVFEVAQLIEPPAAGTLRLVTRGGLHLATLHVPGFAAPRRVAVRAEDVLVATGPLPPISARNVLDGVVEGLDPAGHQVRLRVRTGGETWTARLTSEAARALQLGPGAAVKLVVKAHAILPVAPDA